MKLAIDIVQSLLLPKLEKDASFNINQTNIAFWEAFTTTLLDFEKDTKPVYAAIYSLGLKDAEKIISKLDTVYISFIKELAENHVLGISSEAIDYLITSKNSAFEKEVRFFTDLKNAITKVERKRIKTELPKTFDKLSFEISDDAVALAITKKEREALKEKMNAWDEELMVAEKPPVYSMATNSKEESKVISLSWIKYAVAACLVIGLGVWFFNYNNQGVVPDNKVVTAPKEKDTMPKNTILPQIPSEALAEVTTITKTTPVIEEGLGYASNKVQVIEHNQKARIASIVKAIENYQKMLEKEFSGNGVGYGERTKVIKDSIESLQKELAELKAKGQHYEFDGKALVLYVSDNATENAIVFYEDAYYLRRETIFYKLTVAKQPQVYKRVNNSEIINELDKIYNGY